MAVTTINSTINPTKIEDHIPLITKSTQVGRILTVRSTSCLNMKLTL